jgi:hypothetical protein
MLDVKRREFIALVGSGSLLAAMNKCLAPSNKSRTRGKATQERERLKCSVGSNARDDRGLAVARHAVGPFPSDDHKTSSNRPTAPRGASLFTTEEFASIQNNSGLPQGLAGRSVAACCRQTDCLGSSASGVVISCRAARPIINMRQRDFIARISAPPRGRSRRSRRNGPLIDR